MAVYCQNCGAEIQGNSNYCGQCGTRVGTSGTSAANNSASSNAAKTAATVGGVVVGAAALNRLTHRRRPMYGPHMPPPGGPGFGGPHGPGPGRGGRR